MLAVVSPWALGGAPAWARQVLSGAVLLTGLAVFVAKWRAGLAPLPPRPLWPLLGLVLLGTLQLVPLASSLHALLAPGSAEVWHPPEPAAAAVLDRSGGGISLFPAATAGALLWILGLLALVSLAAPALDHPRARRRCVAVLVAGGLVVAVYGMVARVVFGSLLFGRFPVPTTNPFGPFVSKNHFAGYVGMAALLALGLATALAERERRGPSPLSWTQSPRVGRVFFALVASAALALSVLTAQSRGGAVALGVGALVFSGLRSQSRRSGREHRLRVAAVALVVVSLLALLPHEARARLFGLFGPPDASVVYRLAVWKDALRAWRASPLLGQGLGAFQDIVPRYKTAAADLRVEHAENEYVELLAEGGLTALLLVLLSGALLARAVVHRPDLPGGRRIEGEVAGAAASLAALAAHSLVDFNARLPASSLLAACALALVLGPASGHRAAGGRLYMSASLVCLVLTLLAMPAATPGPGAQGLADVRVSLASMTPSSARARRSEQVLGLHLRDRPADAPGWAILAWLRANAGADDEAQQLGRWASRLDPLRGSLGDYAEVLRARRASRIGGAN